MRALDAPMATNDVGAKTVREYLGVLLLQLWVDKENFSAKRPFGNSDWDWCLYEALVRAKLVKGRFDEFGFLEYVDDIAADKVIKRAIMEMCSE